MNLDDLIITAFCEIDDAMTHQLQQMPGARLRQRGPQPRLCDSEVLCMEVIGAYLGLECDQAIYEYFRRHYAPFFPAIRRIHRTTFAPPLPDRQPTSRTSKNNSGSTGSKTHLMNES